MFNCLILIALVDWRRVALGQAPFHAVTGTSLELPVQLDNEPTPAHTSGMFLLIILFEHFLCTGQFAPRLGTGVISSPVLESTVTRKRQFDQTDLSKIHTYSETIAKI